MIVCWPTETDYPPLQCTHTPLLACLVLVFVYCRYIRPCLLHCHHEVEKDMAIQWFSWRTSWPCCPRQRWRGTCWRWNSSPWPGWGCTRPWCGHAALWSAWRLGRCHLWTRPRHRGSCCARTLHLLSSTSPERRLQIGPFCQKQTTREGRQSETGKWKEVIVSSKAGRGAALGVVTA